MSETVEQIPQALASSGLQPWRHFRSWISAMPLHRRFALAGSLVTLIGMVLTGSWVNRQIESSVTRNSAITTALYMESFIAPLSQELAHGNRLSTTSEVRLRQLLTTPPVSDRIVSAKIWGRDGLLVFSTDPTLAGQRFEMSNNLSRAWRGELTASFDDLSSAESAPERARKMPLLEVYNPIHSIVTGEIIAVAEFYQNAAELEADLFVASMKSWLIVASISALTFAMLFGIVMAGSRTINRQNLALTAQLDELARISRMNDGLRRRIQDASLRASESKERQLRRISAELHDGPAQALALGLLRFDSLTKRLGTALNDPEATDLRRSLDDALRDIRNLCRGLTLPEIEGRSLKDVIAMAVSSHELKTGTSVERDFDFCPTPPTSAPHATLICVYRFLQEGLMNAWRHAGAKGQKASCRMRDGSLEVQVADSGAGFNGEIRGEGLGLKGLRERVESAGGVFGIETHPGGGVRLTMSLPLWS